MRIHEPYGPSILPESIPFSDHCPVSVLLGRRGKEGETPCGREEEKDEIDRDYVEPSFSLAAVPDEKFVRIHREDLEARAAVIG